MKKETSLKLQPWSKKDVGLNVLVYLLNPLVIIGLFLLSAYINCYMGGISFRHYLLDLTKPLYMIIMIALATLVMFVYFFFEDRNFLRKAGNSQMMFLILEVSLIIVYVFGRFVNVYARPLAIVALLTLFLTSRKSAIFMNVIFCVMILFMDSFTNFNLEADYSSLIIGFITGTLAIYLEDKVFSRLALIVRSVIIAAPTVLYVALAHMEYGVSNFIASIASAAASGVLSGLVIFLVLPMFEFLFRRITCFKLSEITDHKSRLIRKIITEAPGTFNHSIVLSNIAEACALAIDEDALLARTCAYYHDVGKLRRPEFFMENQADGFNPHDDLTPELSTNIIRSHAQDGYQLVMKHGLPKEIADVCLEHHGTMPIFYFYGKAKKFTDGEVDVAQYSYFGPKPQSKIAAIIMIADGCEAAVRTISDRSRENVTKVVRKIVSDRMALGQFDECEITLMELNIIINTVVNSLTGVYHSRVEYPALTLEGINEESPLVSGGEKSVIDDGIITAESLAESSKTEIKEVANEKPQKTEKEEKTSAPAKKPKTEKTEKTEKPKTREKAKKEEASVKIQPLPLDTEDK